MLTGVVQGLKKRLSFVVLDGLVVDAIVGIQKHNCTITVAQ